MKHKQESEEAGETGADLYESWQREHPDHARAAKEWEQFLESGELKAALEKAEQAAPRTPRFSASSTLAFWKRAALSLVAASFLFWVLPLQEWIALSQADHSTQVGEQYQGTLPDGSTVILNTDSALQISFSEHHRSVRLLKGEAMFKVTSNPERPFTVAMNHQRITVVGTQFIARISDETEEVLVLEGKVRSESQTEPGSPGRLLQANDRLVHKGDIVSVTKAKGVPAWLNGQLVFDATPLPQAIQEMDRYLPQTLYVMGRSIRDRRLTATYHLDKLDQDVNVLAETLNIQVWRMGPVILFY
ncbi:FecR family protein [Nitrospina watsonii]|uniref:FecR family protein n=1 Tax=Nitrospina watsonii TaxID=1323948 RepID=UPI00249208A6|nr:FecR domain-containing protein [Nitrospina watsonii]